MEEHTKLWTLVLFAFPLPAGTCLECENCFNTGHSCIGSKQACLVDEDTCIVHLRESTLLPATFTTIQKKCSKSSTCNLDVAEANLGNGVYLRSRRICCTGDECNNITVPVLPPPDRKPNGLHRPGCAGMFSSNCHAESVACVGSQKRYTELTGNATGYFFNIECGVKACASEAFCTMTMEDKRAYAFMDVLLTNNKCIEASKISTEAP